MSNYSMTKVANMYNREKTVSKMVWGKLDRYTHSHKKKLDHLLTLYTK